jgi:hypothetical protein
MTLRNIPPEAVAAIAALKGVVWLVVGIAKFQAARDKTHPAVLAYGMVSSHRPDGDYHAATVEYRTAAGELRRLDWRCDTKPSLGQSVQLQPVPGTPDQMEIAEPGESMGKAVFCLAIGAGLLLVAVFAFTAL